MSTIRYFKDYKYDIKIVCGRGISKRFPTHRHLSVSLGMVLKGSRILSINSKKFIIAEGDVFIINSGETHTICQTDNPEHDYIVVSIPRELIVNLLNKEYFLFSNVVFCRELSDKLSTIFNSLISDADVNIELIDIQSLINLIRHFEIKEAEKKAIDARIDKAKNILDNAAIDNHSLEKLANMATLSLFHFSRMFKKNTGMAPHQYLLDNRLRSARELLEKNLSVSDVAIASGFYDTSHFIRHFQNFYGVSPLDFQSGIKPLLNK